MARRFGFECEVARGATATLEILAGQGLTASEYLHEYHCRCGDCDPFHPDYLFHGQEDCTADGEIITSVLEYGSDRADRAFSSLSAALTTARADVSTGQGLHVHVETDDLSPAAKVRAQRLFFRYQQDIGELAGARFGEVRSYNEPVCVPGYWASEFWTGNPEHGPVAHWLRGMWLNCGSPTWEFRLWNATRVEWRMRMAVAVSVAIIEAAAAGVSVTPRTRRPLEAVLGRHLSADGWAGILRQRHLNEKGQAA